MACEETWGYTPTQRAPENGTPLPAVLVWVVGVGVGGWGGGEGDTKGPMTRMGVESAAKILWDPPTCGLGHTSAD